jgi:uncharacterized membrane protein
MHAEDLDRMYADSKNWNPDGSYRCAADPRLLVLSQAGFGWTLNMEHRYATLAMVGVVVLALAIVGIATAWSMWARA